MAVTLDIIQAIGLVSGFALLGTSRIGACIRWTAVQGLLFGALPVVLHWATLSDRVWMLALANVTLKGIVFPAILLRLRRRADFRREVEPFLGFLGSLLAGIGALAVSAWLAWRIGNAVAPAFFPMMVVALFTIAVGLMLIVTRRKALTQVVGYLVLENGIYVFGVGAVVETPALVELGILLDAFVAVFVMGIAAYHITQEFADTDVDKLSVLKG